VFNRRNYYRIRAKHSNDYVEVKKYVQYPGTGDVIERSEKQAGEHLFQEIKADVDGQKFVILPIDDLNYYILPKGTPFVLDVSKEWSDRLFGLPPVITWRITGGDNQKFRLIGHESPGGIECTVESAESLKVWDVKGASLKRFARLTVYTDYKASNQRFIFEPDGTLELRELVPGKDEIRMPPELKAGDPVPSQGEAWILGEAYLPCLAVNDSFPTVEEKLVKSPWYVLSRRRYWKAEKSFTFLKGVGESHEIEIKAGFERETRRTIENTFEMRIGPSINSASKKGGAFANQVNVQLRITSEYVDKTYGEKTVIERVTHAAEEPSKTVVVWVLVDEYVLERMTGAVVGRWSSRVASHVRKATIPTP
jgi:hypothetical protein